MLVRRWEKTASLDHDQVENARQIVRASYSGVKSRWVRACISFRRVVFGWKGSTGIFFQMLCKELLVEQLPQLLDMLFKLLNEVSHVGSVGKCVSQ